MIITYCDLSMGAGDVRQIATSMQRIQNLLA